MVVMHEVDTYRVLMISGYAGVGGNQIAFVYFYEPSGGVLPVSPDSPAIGFEL